MKENLVFEELEQVEEMVDWEDVGTGVGVGFCTGLVLYVAIAT